eukprot:m.299440 g.299440  ORF g.299440 m.299440 type:complete len:181 (+) comp20111_c0_seq2:129-671(+)
MAGSAAVATFTCRVCYESIPVNAPCTVDNDNEPHQQSSTSSQSIQLWTCPKNPTETVCSECINAYTLSRLEDGNIHIPCPADYDVCSHVLEEQELLQYLRPEVASKYTRTCTLVLNPLARACPAPGCDEIVTKGSSAKPNLKCEKCNLRFCFHHGKIECTNFVFCRNMRHRKKHPHRAKR